jgi:RND family efflux transporter MFP subunit
MTIHVNKGKVIKILLAVLIIGAIAVAGAIIIRKKKASLSQIPKPVKHAVPVKTVVAHYGNFDVSKRYLATLKPKNEANVSSRITASILEIKVREGDRARKGELLALLDDREQRDRVAELSARLSAARTLMATENAVFTRDVELFAAKAISRETLDRSKSRAENARAQVTTLEKALSSARTALSYTRITAPFNGIVTRRFMAPGDLAMPGKAIVAIESSEDGYFMEIRLPQTEIAALNQGDAVYVQNPYKPGRQNGIHLNISRIYPATGPGTLGTVNADTPFRPFGLPTGASLFVNIASCRGEGFLVPLEAILETTGNALVFEVMDNETIRTDSIDIVCKGADKAIINSGLLSEGARLVAARESLMLRLHNGQKVYVTRNPSDTGGK